mmetsp:Transcript_18831/g.59098  ORF Transcript_18831/g.59098 Transcript_18831/m.59098 type:complete len:332 (+) Transcript_18831:1327-2322(+)
MGAFLDRVATRSLTFLRSCCCSHRSRSSEATCRERSATAPSISPPSAGPGSALVRCSPQPPGEPRPSAARSRSRWRRPRLPSSSATCRCSSRTRSSNSAAGPPTASPPALRSAGAGRAASALSACAERRSSCARTSFSDASATRRSARSEHAPSSPAATRRPSSVNLSARSGEATFPSCCSRCSRSASSAFSLPVRRWTASSTRSARPTSSVCLRSMSAWLSLSFSRRSRSSRMGSSSWLCTVRGCSACCSCRANTALSLLASRWRASSTRPERTPSSDGLCSTLAFLSLKLSKRSSSACRFPSSLLWTFLSCSSCWSCNAFTAFSLPATL